jgi:hypothetical protein
MALSHETDHPDSLTHPGRHARRAARGLRVALGAPAPLLLAAALALATPGPHYDVPRGYARCPDAKAWHGFFKWASVDGTSCRAAARFMRDYAGKADGAELPTRVDGYRCKVFVWRNDDGDIYASRHTCTRDGKVVRFYGEV